jgi:hypothetical protein
MNILAVDPGYKRSALVAWNGSEIGEHAILENGALLNFLAREKTIESKASVLVIEQMQMFTSNYGVGQEVFDSVFWSGRFAQAWEPRRWDRILRSKIRGHLGASKGGDAAVRQALIARFGPYKEDAIGKKAAPGPLFGVRADEWSALAIAVTYYDLHFAGDTTPQPVTTEF